LAGTAAVIGLARQRRLIDSARAVFAELHANDFRIAPAVIQAVLERCGE
jgi:predicted nucleic acid-binding protein